MSYESLKNWRQQTKYMLVDCLGGKCNRCGYDTTVSALDFHHIDPDTKTSTIADLLKNPRKRKEIVKEAQKCILLCRNCHAEYHDDIWCMSEIHIQNFDTSKLCWNILKEKRFCLGCNKSFTPKHKNHKYCKKECHNRLRTSKLKPKKKELKRMLWQTPMTKIGQIYGVSDKTISKWAKSYSLDKPPRGYFLKSR